MSRSSRTGLGRALSGGLWEQGVECGFVVGYGRGDFIGIGFDVGEGGGNLVLPKIQGHCNFSRALTMLRPTLDVPDLEPSADDECFAPREGVSNLDQRVLFVSQSFFEEYRGRLGRFLAELPGHSLQTLHL